MDGLERLYEDDEPFPQCDSELLLPVIRDSSMVADSPRNWIADIRDNTAGTATRRCACRRQMITALNKWP
jgi:hypothetical protein